MPGWRPPRGPNICGCAARCCDKSGAPADAYHDFAQSATLLDLLGERYQTALSHLAIGRLVARSGAQSIAAQYLDRAEAVFTRLGAERDLADSAAARGAADEDRHRRRRRLACRCRRCAGAARGGCRRAAGTARPRNGGGACSKPRQPTRRSSSKNFRPRRPIGRRSPDATRRRRRRWRAPACRVRPEERTRVFCRVARPSCRRSPLRARRLVASARASRRPPAADDRGGGADRVSICAPPAIGPSNRRDRRSIDRSNRCCPDLSPRAQRWRA